MFFSVVKANSLIKIAVENSKITKTKLAELIENLNQNNRKVEEKARQSRNISTLRFIFSYKQTQLTNVGLQFVHIFNIVFSIGIYRKNKLTVRTSNI